MNLDSFITLGHLIAYLITLTIGLVVTLLLLMWLRDRRELLKQIRRVQLSSYLGPPLDNHTVKILWSKCGKTDREILEEILVDRCRVAVRGELSVATEEVLVATGIHEQWIRDLSRRRAPGRVRAALKLGYVHDSRGVDALVSASTAGNTQVQMAVIVSLGRLKDPRGLPGLIRLGHQGSAAIPALTFAAALAACARGCPSRLVSLLRAPESRTRIIGAWALSETADLTVLRDLLTSSRDREPEVRAKIARALARVEGQESLNTLIEMARDPVWFVRVRALDALGQRGSPSADRVVMAGLEDPRPEVRYRAAFALRRIHGMQGSIVAKVLSESSPRSLHSLISEWDRAGFLSDLTAGLSTRSWPRFLDCQNSLKTLIAAGVTQPLVDFVTVFPDIKVQLRLLRLLLGLSDNTLNMQILALADRQGCDRRVARAIRDADMRKKNMTSANLPSRLV